jgi:phosphopantothenoylcysteine synthetase/decarboxylase
MRVLVTAGCTEVDVDLVRQMRTVEHEMTLSNGFRGQTGERIARYMWAQGHQVTLLTSSDRPAPWDVLYFRTFDELQGIMCEKISSDHYDAVVHSAAVGDYYVKGVVTLDDNGQLVPVDNSAKISSSHKRLLLDLAPTEKIVDKIRPVWGFKGKLVKFKLQVGISDDELLKIARASMEISQADLIVANCREWYKERAYILGKDGSCDSVGRDMLAGELYRRLK